MGTLKVKRIDANAENFSVELEQLLAWESVSDAKVNKIVDDILSDVKARGDDAVIEYTNRFDQTSATCMADLQLSHTQLQEALERISDSERDALIKAAERVERFHQRQADKSWQYEDEDGTVLGQK